MEYYPAINMNTFESVLMREIPIIQSEMSQKEKDKYSNAHIWNLEKWY